MTKQAEVSVQPACSRHPLLDADAWCQVGNARPTGEGVKAWIVCQFACPIRDRCPFDYENAREIIAKGGWYDARGRFFKPPSGMIEVNHAAVYIGVYPGYLHRLLKVNNVPVIYGAGQSSHIKVEDAVKLAKYYGPRHGTTERLKLHILRGETPCTICETVQKYMENGR